MPNSMLLAPSGALLILQAACGVLLLKSSLAGREWLIFFIGTNIFLYMFGFLLPYAWQSGLIDRETMNNVLDRYIPIVSIAASLLLIRFAVVLRAYGHEMDTSGAEAGAKARRLIWPSYLPPGWLTISTICASAACLIHNINGSFMRSIVAGFVPPPQVGAGIAAEFAAQLEFSGNVANAVGGLYIVTVLLWVMCAGFVAIGLAKIRAARVGSAGRGL